MNYFEALVLAVIQGVTEFLPVSSSAHLILFSELLGANQNLFYDVSLHLGTLLAVCIYFRADLRDILKSIIRDKSFIKNQLAKKLIISSVPTLVMGYILVDVINGGDILWSDVP